MQQNEFKEFGILIGKLSAAFCKTVDKGTVAIYFECLDDLSINQIEGAVKYIIKNRKEDGFPKVAEIRSVTLGSVEYRAVAAWGELVSQTYHIEKTFKDPLVEKIAQVAFGGLSNFYSGNERNDMADRPHFIRIYQLIANLREANADRKKLERGEVRRELSA